MPEHAPAPAAGPLHAVDLDGLARTALARPALVEAARQRQVSLALCPFVPGLTGAGLGPPAWVLALPDRLQAVLDALLLHAVQHNPAGGWVRLDWVPCDKHWQVAVHGGGAGYTAEQQRLQLAPDGMQAVAEPGLSLAQARVWMRAMDGELGMVSAPGAGCSCWLSLPAAVPTPPPRQVLYIEDNPVNAALMEAMLGSLDGVQLHCATTPEQGWAAARERQPDLVLMDIQLPGMDGYELLRRLRSDPATQGLTVIAVSANAQAQDLARGEAAGFAAYLTKPLHLPTLLRAVCAALGRPPPEGLGPSNPAS